MVFQASQEDKKIYRYLYVPRTCLSYYVRALFAKTKTSTEAPLMSSPCKTLLKRLQFFPRGQWPNRWIIQSSKMQCADFHHHLAGSWHAQGQSLVEARLRAT